MDLERDAASGDRKRDVERVLHDLSGRCFSAHTCSAQPQRHEFFFSAAHFRSVNSDRKVIGHSSSTVSLNRPLVPFPQCTTAHSHPHIFLSSQIRTQRTFDYFHRMKRCSTVSCNKLHIMLNVKIDLLHSDVGDQSGSIAETAHSTLYIQDHLLRSELKRHSKLENKVTKRLDRKTL